MNKKLIQKIILGGLFLALIGPTTMLVQVNGIIIGPRFPTYTGYVTNIFGQKVANVYVQLFSNGLQVSTDYTDSNGYYCVGNDYVSNGYIKFSKTNYITKTISVSSSGGQYNVVLASNVLPTYTGYVKTTSGQPIANALVRLFSNDIQVCTDYTDSNGYYCVGNEIVSYGYIRVEHDDYIPERKSVSDHGGYYDFILGVGWALVVGGETEERFTRDAFGMYNTLIDHYGFTDERIYLITTRTTIDGSNVPRDRATSRDNIEWATDQIAANCHSNDQVVIWWTGHGSIDEFATDADSITASQFDSYLDDISCEKMFIFLGPCHSGSFIDDLDDEENRAIYTSCKADQSGYLSSGSEHSLFPWATYRGLDADLDADDADTNDDGRVSLYELFNYCVDFVDDNTSESQDPQRWVGSSFADAGYFIGDSYY